MSPIRFYSTTGDYGCFSNFSRHPVKISGKTYATTEAYFQSQKFAGVNPAYENKVAKEKSPKVAAAMGRDRSVKIRRDWDSVKDSVMLVALHAKAKQHPSVAKTLLDTGDEEIIEDTTNDYYWGCGSDGSGKNMLGRLWMRVRNELRQGGRHGS